MERHASGNKSVFVSDRHGRILRRSQNYRVSISTSIYYWDMSDVRRCSGLQQHPNVVQTFGVSLDGQLPCIVLELCEGGSLDNRLFDSDVTLSQQQKIALVKGIARGLYHLHTNNIVHRDLAARNVLVSLRVLQARSWHVSKWHSYLSLNLFFDSSTNRALPRFP